MAWGYGTTVEDTEVYEGQPDTDVGQNEFDLSSGLVGQEPVTIDEYVSASSSGSVTINVQRLADKISFYLDESEFGLTYTDDPLSAKFGITQGGNTNWEAQVGGSSRLFGSPIDRTGVLNANVGIAGQGTSGSVSPYADFNVGLLPELNLNLHGQSYPGGYSELNPSASYQNEFNTPWGTGLINANIGRQGGRTVGGFKVRGDF